MKKYVSLVVTALLLVFLSSCGKSNKDTFIDNLKRQADDSEYNAADFQLKFQELDIDSKSGDTATDMTLSALASGIEDMKLSGSFLRDDKSKANEYELELDILNNKVPLDFIQNEDAFYFKADSITQMVELENTFAEDEDEASIDLDDVEDSLEDKYVKFDQKDFSDFSEEMESLAYTETEAKEKESSTSILAAYTKTLSGSSFKKDGDVYTHTYSKKELKELVKYAQKHGVDEIDDSFGDADHSVLDNWDDFRQFSLTVSLNDRTGKAEYQFKLAYKDKDYSVDTKFSLTTKPDSSDDEVELPDEEDVISLADVEDTLASGSYYDDEEEDEDYQEDYQEAYDNIDQIPGWSQELYDSITPATENYDSNSNKTTYSDGSKYKDLLAKVGKPSSTTSYTNEEGETTVTADWDSPDSSSTYVSIEVSYDQASDQITSISCY